MNIINNSNKSINSPKEGGIVLLDDDIRDNDAKEDTEAMHSESDEFSTSLQLRDGGYAWLVLCGIILSTSLIHGYMLSFGILSSAVMDFYPDSSGVMAGIIIGLLSASRNLLTPFIGILANRIGIRISMCFGAFLYAGSMLLSFFCTSVAQLSITLGVFTGLSNCIIESSQINVMSQYFVAKLSIANGLRGAASPFGGIIYPIILTALLENFGLKLTFLLLGAINLHTLISATLMRPLSVHLKIKALEKSRDLIKNKEYQEILLKSGFESESVGISENCNLNPDTLNKRSRDLLRHDQENLYLQILQRHENIKKEKPKKKLQFKFFKIPNYLLYIVLACIIPMVIPLVTYYTVLYANKQLRLTSYEITILVSFQSTSDFFLRIFIGYINNKKICDKSVIIMICFWICAIGVFLIPLGSNLTMLMVSVGLYTFGPSSYIASLTVILCEEFGKENITTTWGFVKMTHGIFALVNAMFIGYLVDATGGYTIPFIFMACCIGLCGCFMGIQIFVRKYLLKETCTLNTIKI